MFKDSWQFQFRTLMTALRASRSGSPRCVGASGRLIIWRPFKPMLFKLCGLRQSWQMFLTARAQIADPLRRHSFTCGNLSSRPSYFRLLQWRLIDPYRLAPRVAAPLVHPLIRVWLQGARIFWVSLYGVWNAHWSFKQVFLRIRVLCSGGIIVNW